MLQSVLEGDVVDRKDPANQANTAMNMTESPILRIRGLNKTYGKFTALHDIDIDVPSGEFLTIVGPSGSGKTTLIKLLVGMEDQTRGEIWLRDQRLDILPANKRPTCMVFQSLALFPHRSVGQNIEFPLKVRGTEPSARESKARELLDLFRLPQNYYTKRIDECSGGERQRIALARALAFDPEILFFDEPLSALDFRLRKTLEKELKALHERTGKTFVYITHSLEEAMIMSDRIAILREGRFEQIGPAAEIYSKPRSRFVASFMGDVNLFDVSPVTGKVEGLEVASTNALVNSTKGGGSTLMVRPEKLRFLAWDDKADFQTSGQVAGSYLLGSRTQYEIRSTSGANLVLETGNETRLIHTGDTVKVGFSGEDAHLIADASV